MENHENDDQHIDLKALDWFFEGVGFILIFILHF